MLVDHPTAAPGFTTLGSRRERKERKRKKEERETNQKVEQERQVYPLGVEGQSESSWILIDYADVIVHILGSNIGIYSTNIVIYGVSNIQ